MNLPTRSSSYPNYNRICLRLATLALAFGTSFAVTAQTASPTPLYRWTTLAGRATTGHDDGPAADAHFNGPHGVAVDSSGNLFVADTVNCTIRKISPSGIVTTFAGSPDQLGSTDGTGSAARFNLPQGIAVDPQGNVYVADTGNHTVRKITSAGVVTTLAGFAGAQGSTDGTGNAARFSFPVSIFADAAGNVYVLQQGVRRITPGGAVDTINLTGTITTPGGAIVTVTADGTAAVDTQGQIYFVARPVQSDGSLGSTKRIVKRDASGSLSVLASSDSSDAKPYISTSVTEVIMTTDGAGSVYFVTQLISSIIEYTLYQISPSGTLENVAWRGASRGGYADIPKGLTIGTNGKIYHTAPANDDVIFLNEGAQTSIYAGTLWSNRGLDGTGGSARFSGITGLASTPGQLLVSDKYTNYNVHVSGGATLRTVSPAGEVSTLYTGPNRESPTENSLGVAALAAGNIALGTYHATSNLTQITSSGAASPLAKGDFQEIHAMASDSNGQLFVAERRALHQRAVDGTWSILAGNPSQPADIIDGNRSNARFANIISLSVAPNGDAYVLDHLTVPTVRASIRRIQPNGNVTTIRENVIHADGTGPLHLAVDAKGDFILTYGDDTVRLLNASNTEFIIGGTSGQSGLRDGDGQTAQFYQPDKIATDAQNNIFVADNARVTIRKGEFLGYSALISSQPQSVTVNVGAAAQFSVTASGTPAPTYQWQFNGVAIAGATSAILAINNAQTSNAGSYTVVVSNNLGTVTSNAATLTVNTPSTPPPPVNNGGGNTGSGGGGAPSTWFLAALLLLGLGRRFFRTR